MPLFEVRSIYKQYPLQLLPAVGGISFSVDQGEILAIVGESGAGKTTLLRLLAGLEEPDAGTVWLNGQLVRGPAFQLVAGHPDIALSHQHQGLSPTMNVFDNLTLSLLHLPKESQARRVDKILAWCRLHEIKHKFPRELSGGERQRVGVARALIQQPKVLLLDEPFSHLDVALRRQLRDDLLQIVAQSNITLILVTHDPADALAVSDRVAVMQAGQLRQLATPRQVYAAPVSPYAAFLFGETNIVPALELAKVMALPAHVPPQALLCIRPEQIVVCPAKQAQFWGEVRQTTFLGAHLAIAVQVSGAEIALRLLVSSQHEPARTLALRIDQKMWHYFLP